MPGMPEENGEHLKENIILLAQKMGVTIRREAINVVHRTRPKGGINQIHIKRDLV